MSDRSGPVLAAPDLAVYVHWPFCQAKCPYCDFNSHVRAHGIDEARYLSAYLSELDHMASLAPGGRIASVFFGGGTPSLMTPGTVAAILDRITQHWPLAEAPEITLEANPTSVEANRFAGYRAAGVNRVSLGIQALNDADLTALGRLHSTVEALSALDVAKAHFDRVSFDLIYARPRQTERDWEAELAEALALADGHLSLYQLTIEPGTPFAALQAAGRLRTPGPEPAADLYELTQSLTEAAGFETYEISNHARAGETCRHNLIYWRGGDYVGVGPGAHGRISHSGRRHATTTIKAPEAWLAAVESGGHGMTHCMALSRPEVAEEYFLMSLRLAEGTDLSRLEALGAPSIEGDRLSILEDEGLIARNGPRLKATARGRLVLNSIIAVLAA